MGEIEKAWETMIRCSIASLPGVGRLEMCFFGLVGITLFGIAALTTVRTYSSWHVRVINEFHLGIVTNHICKIRGHTHTHTVSCLESFEEIVTLRSNSRKQWIELARTRTRTKDSILTAGPLCSKRLQDCRGRGPRPAPLLLLPHACLPHLPENYRTQMSSLRGVLVFNLCSSDTHTLTHIKAHTHKMLQSFFFV